MVRIRKTVLTILAAIFLVEAWLWDGAVALGHWCVRQAPWERAKAALAAAIDRLPPYGVLPIFLVPIAVIEPLKIVAIEQIAQGHLLQGVLAFIVLKFVGLGLIAFVFDLTKAKLLQIGWFARFYAFVCKWRDKAHDFIAPYKAALHVKVAAIKAYVAERRRALASAALRLFPWLVAKPDAE